MTARRLTRLTTDLEAQARITEQALALLEDETLITQALEDFIEHGGGPVRILRAYRALLRAKLRGHEHLG
jgi:hypothetical protein